MADRLRQRRTLGSGPPPDLLFGELAYSDGDGLLHVGRPDGTALSFAPGAVAHSHDYAALGHTHDYAALVHTHAWGTLADIPATFPPSSHTHDYAASVHSHAWSTLTGIPATFPPSSHTHDYAASVHSHAWADISSKPTTFPTTWAEVASKPATFPTTWAEVASKPTTFAPSTHTHGQTTISLTPLNGFTAVNPNRLVVLADLRLAIIFFSVARTTIPVQNTTIFSWDATYTPLFANRVTVTTIGGANNDSVHLYWNGASLIYNRRTGVATQIDACEGQLFFTY